MRNCISALHEVSKEAMAIIGTANLLSTSFLRKKQDVVVQVYLEALCLDIHFLLLPKENIRILKK